MPKTKILIVEDEAMLRDLCAAVLRSHGFESITTANGVEGLACYRERHEEIGLVLCDVSMPFMGGIELSRNLFEIDSHANVILMTGHRSCDLIPADIKKICSVVEKPFTPGYLLNTVRKCLKYERERHLTAAMF